jgi:hypothetical protein
VLLYLSPAFNLRLRPTILEQLRPGSRVVSHAFHMGDWEADSTVVVGSGAERANLYLWTVPENVDGFWTMSLTDEASVLTLELFQRFQTVSGSLWNDRIRISVDSGSLRGSEIEFHGTVSPSDSTLRFRGAVTEGRIDWVIECPGPWNGRRWSATRIGDSD